MFFINSSDATMCRAIVARGIYLAQDRSDIAVAAKELSRRMSAQTPETGSHRGGSGDIG